ncbi:hypothetical protein CGRA01v4_15071 [Colletotrichum graminicola]|nr:hypothetical protein CGRA01v4_15071 [Colletotrichum graminicola]
MTELPGPEIVNPAASQTDKLFDYDNNAISIRLGRKVTH